MKSIIDVLKKQNKQPKRATQKRENATSRRSSSTTRKKSSDASSRGFKRGRSMPGATSSGIRSADKNALRAATPREKINHLAYIRRVVTTTLGVLLAGTILLFIVVHQFTATVKLDYKYSSSIAYISNDYIESIQSYLKSHPTERIRFLLDDAKLTEHVQHSFPEIASITHGGNDGFATTSFEVDVRDPVVSWKVSDTTYYVDAEGVSFTRNYFDEPSVDIIDNSSIQYTPGTAIASERFLSFVGRIIANIEKGSKYTVTEIEIPTGTTRQVKVYIKGYDYPAFVSIERGPAVQAEDIKQSIGYIESHDKKPNYIDVRVEGKAFYRE